MPKQTGLTIKAAAEKLGVSTQTIRNYIDRGILSATLTGPDGGRLVRIDERDVDQLAELKRSSEQGLTVHQVAEMLGVPANTVRSWIRNGKLPARRLGPEGSKRKHVRLDPADVEQLQSRPKPPKDRGGS